MRQITRQHLKIILILSKLKEKENVTIFKKIKHYLFKLFISTVEPRDICHPSPTTTGINNILSSLSTFTNLA
jgi:hypothetical protein